MELNLSNVSFCRGAFELEIASLNIHKGEKIAILGENGCGKTTLLQVIAALIMSKGNVTLIDSGVHEDLFAMNSETRANRLSYLPQKADMLFNLTVKEVVNLRYGGYSLANAELIAMISALELDKFKDRRYHELSGGEKRRVMLARVLANDADFILLDEPTAPLDMRHTWQVMSYLKSRQAAVVAAVHDINLATKYFNRFLLMKEGHILFDKGELDEQTLETIYGVPMRRCNDHFVLDI